MIENSDWLCWLENKSKIQIKKMIILGDVLINDILVNIILFTDSV